MLRLDYWQHLSTLTKDYRLPEIQTQFQAMTAVKQALAKGKLPEHALPKLGLCAESFAQALLLPGADFAQLRTLDHLLRNFRFYIAYHYGMWAFVQRDLFATWQSLYGATRYLEVAAGNGYLSLGLKGQGNSVITSDNLAWTKENVTGQKPVVPVVSASATEALWRFGSQVDAVVMAWSPDKDPNDVHFLHVLRQFFPQLKLFVIGERFGATNSRLFWQTARFVPDRRLLALNRAFPRFDAINDRIYQLA